MTLEGAFDGVAFQIYIDRLLIPTLKDGDIVFMDNLSVHKMSGVRKSIEEAGAILIYLPPYSPDLNPIELCWSKLKSLLRTAAARTRDAVDAAIAGAMNLITSANALAWFRHAGYWHQFE